MSINFQFSWFYKLKKILLSCLSLSKISQIHLSARFIIRHQRILHTLRVVIACAIALLIIRIFKFPHSSWAEITIIVVMGPISYMGTVLTKANQRLCGTIIGATLGFSLFLLPAQSFFLHDILLLFMLGLAIYCVNGKYSYAAVLVGLTLFLVAGSGSEDFDMAKWRAINVIWGCLLTIICSRLFFPSRALIHFQLLVSELLLLCADYYILHARNLHNTSTKMEYNLKSLNKNLEQQAILMVHINKEWKGNTQQIINIIMMERRVVSVLETLLNRQWQSQNALKKIRETPLLMNGITDLFQNINKLSQQVNQANIEQLLSEDIPLLKITNQSFNNVENNPNIENFNYFGYLWLNHELSRHVSALSFNLSHVFNAQHFK